MTELGKDGLVITMATVAIFLLLSFFGWYNGDVAIRGYLRRNAGGLANMPEERIAMKKRAVAAVGVLLFIAVLIIGAILIFLKVPTDTPTSTLQFINAEGVVVNEVVIDNRCPGYPYPYVEDGVYRYKIEGEKFYYKIPDGFTVTLSVDDE